mgnify:CR=1 FL=1
MPQKQWIVVGIAALLFGVLSLLPKSVVDNDAIAVNEGPAMPEEQDENHASSTTPEQQVAISLAKKNFEKSSGSEKSRALDSLIVKFIVANRYDSAARYAESFAQMQGGDEWKERAGELYYEAFTFSLSEDKAQRMARKTKDLFEPLVEKYPEKLDLRVKLGMTEVISGTPMKGVRMIRGVLEDDPENLFATMQLGLLSMRSGQYGKAVSRFERVLELDEGNIEALYYLGISHAEQDHHEEAEKALKRVKALGSDPAMLQTVDQYLNQLSEHEH